MDDTLVTGTKDMIDWFYDIVQEKFTITDLGKLKKHLEIWYRWKTDSKGEQYVEATMSKLAEKSKNLTNNYQIRRPQRKRHQVHHAKC